MQPQYGLVVLGRTSPRQGQQIAEQLIVVAEVKANEIGPAEHGAQRDGFVAAAQLLSRETGDHPDRCAEVVAADEAGALRARDHLVDPRARIDVAYAGVTLDHFRLPGVRAVDELCREAGEL